MTPQTKEQLRAELLHLPLDSTRSRHSELGELLLQSEIETIVSIFATHLQTIKEAVEAELPEKVDRNTKSYLKYHKTGFNEALDQFKAALDKGFER